MNAKIAEVVLAWFEFCQRRRVNVVEALVKLVPFAGEALATLVREDDPDVQQIVAALDEKVSERLDEIASILEAKMAEAPPPTRYIVTVGAGYTEHILRLPTSDAGDPAEISVGHKHMVECSDSVGGSGVNYALRLLHAGYPVLPIPGLGRCHKGIELQREMRARARSLPGADACLAFIDSPDFFVTDDPTPRSTIIVQGPRRTIFTEPVTSSDIFRKHLERRLEWICEHVRSENIAAVLIGHIHADGPSDAADGPPVEPTCTGRIIECFHKHSLLYANFGASQIAGGVHFWEPQLKRLDIFQLHISEMRRLFRREGKKSLYDMLEWFSDHGISVVITLDRLGAIGRYRHSAQSTLLAWPYELPNVKDPTGAGDAFGAGLVSRLYPKKRFSSLDFQGAVNEARVWAAYACSTEGGASDCPDDTKLATLRDQSEQENPDPVELHRLVKVDRLLYVIDKAFE